MLGAIVAAARTMVATRRQAEPQAQLEIRAARRQPAGSAFREALCRPGRLNIIAECKRRSPSRGVLCATYDPAAIARSYERGGAAAVSVLTEPTFFDGALAHLERVREAISLPVLRKDFIADEYQLLEARACGADAILLIVAALDPSHVQTLIRAAAAHGLAVLVEVHTSDEVRLAIDAGATIVGVNSRNLRTLDVDLQACDRLIGDLPPGCVAVAESGMHSPGDLQHLSRMGYQAFLIGEWLMSSAHPERLLASLVTSTPPWSDDVSGRAGKAS